MIEEVNEINEKKEAAEEPAKRKLSKDELEEILSNHEKWVESFGKEGSQGILSNVDLQGEDFSDRLLNGIIFNNADLRNTNFHNASLMYYDEKGISNLAEIIHCDMRGADLSDAGMMVTIEQTDLSDANLKNCQMSICYIKNSVLNNANLEGADLSGSKISNVSMNNANLKGADLGGSKISNVSMKDVDLSNIDMKLAELKKCDLQGADFTGAKFEKNQIVDCDFSSAKIDDLDLLKIGLDSWAMRKDTQVVQLVDALRENGKGREAEQIMLLVGQMQEMGNSYHAVFRELQETKMQLNQLQEQLGSKPQMQDRQSIIVEKLASFEGGLQNQVQNLQTVMQKFNEKAGIILQKLENSGIKALNNVCGFLNIKESLVKLRDTAQSNAVKMESSIEMIDEISNEAGKMKVHLKNIGNILTGKETIDSPSPEQAKIFKDIKNHYQHNQKKFENRAEKLNKAIQRFDELEHAADRSLNSERSSVKEKLANNKAAVEARDSSEPKQIKEKQQPEVAL